MLLLLLLLSIVAVGSAIDLRRRRRPSPARYFRLFGHLQPLPHIVACRSNGRRGPKNLDTLNSYDNVRPDLLTGI